MKVSKRYTQWIWTEHNPKLIQKETHIELANLSLQNWMLCIEIHNDWSSVIELCHNSYTLNELQVYIIWRIKKLSCYKKYMLM